MESVIRAKDNALYESAVEVLKSISDTYYFTFYNLLSARSVDIFQYIAFLGELKEKVKLDQFIDGLLAFTKRGIYIYNGIKVDGVDEGEIKQYQKIFITFKTSDIAYILNTLLDIQKSPDIESRLILLGYTGIRKPKPEVTAMGNGEDMAEQYGLTRPESDIAAEKSLSSEAFKETTTATAEEIKDIEKQGTAPVSMDSILKSFNVTTFTGDSSMFD